MWFWILIYGQVFVNEIIFIVFGVFYPVQYISKKKIDLLNNKLIWSIFHRPDSLIFDEYEKYIFVYI
jgi:hypothetical protein